MEPQVVAFGHAEGQLLILCRIATDKNRQAVGGDKPAERTPPPRSRRLTARVPSLNLRKRTAVWRRGPGSLLDRGDLPAQGVDLRLGMGNPNRQFTVCCQGLSMLLEVVIHIVES